VLVAVAHEHILGWIADSPHRFPGGRGTRHSLARHLLFRPAAVSFAVIRVHRLGAMQSVLRGYDSSPNHAFNRTRRHIP
jgi:hypothetical protein